MHLAYMQRALDLARRGQGWVEPNPMVGAVVVKDNRVVGEGWHARFGGPHAEVVALDEARSEAEGATLYVTLEPCCHHGKTPPCVHAILQAGIKRVIAAMTDPFPKVSGGGFAKLRDAGVEVVSGVGEELARNLNAPYLTRLVHYRPWVIAKWAMSLDGKIATRTGDSKWISNDEARRVVQELRSRVDAIIVGRGTVMADNPNLTARVPQSFPVPRKATRIVVTQGNELPRECELLRSIKDAPLIIATTNVHASHQHWIDTGAELLVMNDLGGLLKELADRNFTNVLVEGGSQLLGSLFDLGAIDEAHVFIAPKIIGRTEAFSPIAGRGVEWIHDATHLHTVTHQTLGDNLLIRAQRRFRD